jgi:hypothetical protein
LKALLGDTNIQDVVEEVDHDAAPGIEQVVIEYTDGTRYEGGVVNNEWAGTGRCFFSNGNFYEGEVDHDVLHGVGTLIYANGDKVCCTNVCLVIGDA